MFPWAMLSTFRYKGELRGGEVPGESKRFSFGICQEVFYGTVTSRQLLQNPDDHTVHSEGSLSSQNPSLLELDVPLKSVQNFYFTNEETGAQTREVTG